MKYIIISLYTILLLNSGTSCQGQQIIQTPIDAQKLLLNKNRFINKPLKYLLKEIKPEIKRITTMQGSEETNSYIFFNFIDNTQYYKERALGKRPITITILIKERDFQLEPKTTSKEDKFAFTQEKKERYENLTIGDIRVSGEN